MHRHCYHPGVAAASPLLLLSIVISALALMSTSTCTAKLRSNGIVLNPMKYKIVTHHTIELNGFKENAVDIFDKIINFFSAFTNEPLPLPPTARASGSKPSRSGSTKNGERFTVHHITGDGRCMFRSLASGMAFNDGDRLLLADEQYQADELKMDIKRLICDSDEWHQEFDDAIFAITIEETLESYCQRIIKPNFWGGEAELMILSKLLSLPITVYIPSQSQKTIFIEIAKYKPEYKNGATRSQVKKDVRILYSDNNHYDLLLLST